MTVFFMSVDNIFDYFVCEFRGLYVGRAEARPTKCLKVYLSASIILAACSKADGRLL